MGRVRYETATIDLAGDAAQSTSSTLSNGFFKPDFDTVLRYTEYTYDPISRVKTATDKSLTAATATTAMSYTGWVTQATDPDGNRTDTTTDAFGNVTKVVEDVGGGGYVTTYTYNTRGDLEAVSPHTGPDTTIQYDLLGRKTSMVDPDMGAWAYEYDNNGNLKQQTDGRGRDVHFTYDALDRVTTKRQDSTSGTLISRFVYDTVRQGALDWSEAYSTWGTTRTDYTAYDAVGRPTASTLTVPGPAGGVFARTWVYGDAGQLESKRLPGDSSGGLGETVTYGYDTRSGQPTTLTSSDIGSVVSASTYNPVGQLTAQTLGGSVVYRTADYDDATGRLDWLKAGTTSSGSTDLLDLVYDGYTPAGDIETIVDHRDGGQRQCFTYDGLHRLTRAFTGNGTCTGTNFTTGTAEYDRTFTYDPVGNVTRVDHGYPSTPAEVYLYGGSQPHAVTAVGSNTYSYDANGAMATRTVGGVTQTNSYDYEQRLVTVAETGGDTEFVYDADGNRVARYDEATDTWTVFVGVDYEVATTAGSGGGPPGVELLAEPGFETSAGWTDTESVHFPATSIRRSTWGMADQHSGSWGKAIHNLAYGRVYSDYFTVESGEDYDVSIWLRGEMDTESHDYWIVRAMWYTSSGSYVGYENVDYASTLPSSWTEKSGTVTAPATATQARLYLWFRQAAGWVAFDDVSMTKTGTSTNLVPNPGFETATGWYTATDTIGDNTTGFVRDTTGVGEGRTGYGYAIHQLASGGVRSDPFTVTAGDSYDVSAWVRGEIDPNGSHGGWLVKIRWYDNGVELGHDIATSATSVTGTYSEHTGTVTAPAGADTATVEPSVSDLSGWVAYDDISVKKTGTSTNLVLNPGFETGEWTDVFPAGYRATATWRDTWGMADQHTGSYAMAISNAAYGWVTSDPVTVTEGVTYDISGWVRGELDPDDSHGEWIIRAMWYNAADQLLEQDDLSGAPGSVSTTWAQYSGSFSAPTDAATLRVRLYNHSNNGWAAFDDLSVKAQPGGGTTTTVTTHYSLGSDRVAVATDGDVTWLIGDHLGSTTIAHNPTTGTQKQRFTPYGAPRDGNVTATEYGYTGQRADQSTGLMYYQARYYDPTLRRFTQPDTIIPNPLNPQDLNRYTYTRNNPVKYTDPSGHKVIGSDSYGCMGTSNCTISSAVRQPDGGWLITERTIDKSGGDDGGVEQFDTNAPIDFGTGSDVNEVVLIGLEVAAGDVADAVHCADGFGWNWNTVADCGLAVAPFVSRGLLNGFGAGLKKLFGGPADEIATNTAPPIKPGAAGGPTAGKPFPGSVRDATLAENPGTCVYCRMETPTPQVDHAIPRVRGGNATLDNAQTTCPWCNASKGPRDFPVNPPPGYRGLWPPSWWDL